MTSAGSHVPYESLVELRAAYMPAAARAVSGIPPALAGVDGAIVVTGDLAVLGFGATIAVRNQPQATPVYTWKVGQEEMIRTPLQQLGGTRHQSAARFIAANKDAVAIAISQDRYVSAMHWDESIGAVAVFRNAEWWV